MGFTSYGKCSCRYKDGKVRVTMEFDIRQILYDISNMAWVQGDLLSDAELNLVRHHVQGILDEGNRDRVMRIVDLAHAEAVEMLYPWSRRELEGSVYLDDTPEKEDTLELLLTVPRRTGQGTINLLLKLVHEWIVCRVLHDWLSITYPAGAGVWEARLEELQEAIKNAKNRSNWIVRRPMFPSW